MRDIHWLREAEDEFADIIDYVIIQPRTGVFAFSRLNNFVKTSYLVSTGELNGNVTVNL